MSEINYLTFNQITSQFSDLTYAEQAQQYLSLRPNEYETNTIIESTDRQMAGTVVSEEAQFRPEDFARAGQQFSGVLTNPYQTRAQLENVNFDPFYYDGSERTDMFNVEENLIGTPLGSTLLEDPRKTFIENTMKIKEIESETNRLDHTWVQQLYLANAEKGSNYYLNQIQKAESQHLSN
jgi:hypothetical protein